MGIAASIDIIVCEFNVQYDVLNIDKQKLGLIHCFTEYPESGMVSNTNNMNITSTFVLCFQEFGS